MALLCTGGNLGKPCSTFTRAGADRLVKGGGNTAGAIAVLVRDGDAEHVTERAAKLRADQAAQAAARDAPPPGAYLTGDELRALLAGKTTRETQPHIRDDTPALMYFVVPPAIC